MKTVALLENYRDLVSVQPVAFARLVKKLIYNYIWQTRNIESLSIKDAAKSLTCTGEFAVYFLPS